MSNDDLSFEQLMALDGVKKLAPAKSTVKAQAPKQKRAKRPAFPKMPAPPPNPLAARVAELEAERDALIAAGEQGRAEIERMGAALEAAKKATVEADELRDAALETEDAHRDEIARLRGALEAEKDTVTSTLLARQSVAQVLMDRGCADDLEMMQVLNGLLLQRPREFLEALVLAHPQELTTVLVERVAFVSRDVEFAPDANTVVVYVKKDRCEISGGSDVQANFHGFVQACLDQEVTKITIVGGSPAYRKQLKLLAQGHDDAPTLNLVSGTRRREKRRAEADMRGSEAVVLWGGSELDHSVTSVYSGRSTRLIRVAHRGIARMLQLVRSELRKKA
jgi:hypothetical protein